MTINIDGQTMTLETKAHFKIAIAYFSTKSRINLEKGNEAKAKQLSDQSFALENELRSLSYKNNL